MKNSMKLALSLLCAAVVVTSNVQAFNPLYEMYRAFVGLEQPVNPAVMARVIPADLDVLEAVKAADERGLGALNIVPTEAVKAADKLGFIECVPNPAMLDALNPKAPSRATRALTAMKSGVSTGLTTVGTGLASAYNWTTSTRPAQYVSGAFNYVNTSKPATFVKNGLTTAANYTVVPVYAVAKAHPKKSVAVVIPVAAGLAYAAYRYGLVGKAKNAATTAASKVASVVKAPFSYVASKFGKSAQAEQPAVQAAPVAKPAAQTQPATPAVTEETMFVKARNGVASAVNTTVSAVTYPVKFALGTTDAQKAAAAKAQDVAARKAKVADKRAAAKTKKAQAAPVAQPAVQAAPVAKKPSLAEELAGPNGAWVANMVSQGLWRDNLSSYMICI